jgi:hypothetical protein
MERRSSSLLWMRSRSPSSFFDPGVYTFTAVYLGSGQFKQSTSNTVVVTVSSVKDGRFEAGFSTINEAIRLES